jgi:hypothetical protein
MKGRIFIVTLAAASLLSFGAMAGNSSTIGQFGFYNHAGVAQSVGFGSNKSSISQFGVNNTAITMQSAGWAGSNSSTVTQGGAGNVAVTVQSAH